MPHHYRYDLSLCDRDTAITITSNPPERRRMNDEKQMCVLPFAKWYWNLYARRRYRLCKHDVKTASFSRSSFSGIISSRRISVFCIHSYSVKYLYLYISDWRHNKRIRKLFSTHLHASQRFISLTLIYLATRSMYSLILMKVCLRNDAWYSKIGMQECYIMRHLRQGRVWKE